MTFGWHGCSRINKYKTRLWRSIRGFPRKGLSFRDIFFFSRKFFQKPITAILEFRKVTCIYLQSIKKNVLLKNKYLPICAHLCFEQITVLEKRNKVFREARRTYSKIIKLILRSFVKKKKRTLFFFYFSHTHLNTKNKNKWRKKLSNNSHHIVVVLIITYYVTYNIVLF